jgi:galactokinase
MSSEQLFKNTFGTSPSVNAFAPGRVEFIGNHTDYNGGDVMGVAIDKGVFVSASLRKDSKIKLISAISDTIVERDLSAISNKLQGKDSWTNYPIGIIASLLKRGYKIETGFDFAITSNLPVGAGLSSSAAIELGTLCAIAKLLNFDISKADMARIGRQAENEYVGIPSGILDQGSSAHGQDGSIVYINCKDEEFSALPIGKRTYIWIFNSDHKHSLVDSMYAQRHKECFEAFDFFKKKDPSLESLCHLNINTLEENKDQLKPDVYKRAYHVINEHNRVHKVKEALNSLDKEGVGKLLTASHQSSRDYFENSINELDFLVDKLNQVESVFGARLTGGGFGGAVMALTDDSFNETDAQKIAALYKEKFGGISEFFKTVPSEGARVL